jgi:hypothetical protein
LNELEAMEYRIRRVRKELPQGSIIRAGFL